VVVTTPVLSLPGHRRTLEAAFERMRSLYAFLKDTDVLRVTDERGPIWTGPPPLRAAARISGDYLLRYTDILTGTFGDVSAAAIWLETFRSNNEARRGREYATDTIALSPVRPAAVAKKLGLPAETVRRRVAQLVAEGRCEWMREGLIASPVFINGQAFDGVMRQNLARSAGCSRRSIGLVF
jgi:hypothetical protein